MKYTDYLQKAGIKQKKIKGLSVDYKKLRKVVPSEIRFNKDDLINNKNKRIMSI